MSGKYEANIPISAIRPIQACGVSLPHLLKLEQLGELPPGEVVLLTGQPNTDTAAYLLTDGTHRTYRDFAAGRETTRAYVIATDEAVLGSVAIALAGCTNLQQVRDRYNEIWKPLLEERGVLDIASLPLRGDGR